MNPPVRLKIVQTGEPVLRQIGRRLTPEEIALPAIQELIEHMRDTMRDAPGVGLAAPQVGLPIQLAVVEDRAEYLTRHRAGAAGGTGAAAGAVPGADQS